MKHILIYNHDIQKYPPILTAIKILLSLGKKVVILGYCSDKNTILNLQSQGVVYHKTIINDIKESKLVKLLKLFTYTQRIKKIVNNEFQKDSLLWIYGNENIWLLHQLIFKYKAILYLFEMPALKVDIRYKIVSPFLNYQKTMQKGWKVVCCEYNRAHITKAYFNLENLPAIIPNKPDFDISKLRDILEEEIQTIFTGKKVILYQGIFNYPERRLDELCESINYLPEEYIICVMGGNDGNKERLMNKYKSDRVVFLPFIGAPNHLEITKKAFIGFLSYFPTQGAIENVLNTLYCAPNKIYEYSCFGVPMLSNDVPGLSSLFEKHKAGKAVTQFDAENLAKAILEIESNYHEMKSGSLALYNSINVRSLFQELIK